MPHHLTSLVIAVCLGCGGRTAGVVETIPPPVDTVWRPPVARSAPAASLRDLTEAVMHLGTATDDLSHRTMVATLGLLAGAVRDLGAGAADEAAEIDALAAKLEASPPTAPRHLELVAGGLHAALAAIAEADTETAGRERRGAFVAARHAVDALERGRPLRQQTAHVHLAFAATVDALAAASGAARPFASLIAAPEGKPDREAFARHTARASELVGEVATARDSATARAKTAEALLALASAIEHAPMDAQTRSDVVSIRFEAFRLERAGATDLRRVDWAKAGLVAAAQALEGLVPAGLPVLTALARGAERSAEAINARESFAFQRVAIQDALRAITDGYVALAASPGPSRSGTAAR